jgi:hypothetical protein
LADVFISYKREERGKVEQIAAQLQTLGLSIWFDASLEGGRSFHSEIDDELRAAKIVIVCWSKSAVASNWVLSESQIGLESTKLVPVFLESCKLPPPFNSVHTLDLSRWKGGATDPDWLSVVNLISKKMKRPGLEHLAHAVASGEQFVARGENEALSDDRSKAERRESRESGKEKATNKKPLSEHLGSLLRRVFSGIAKTISVLIFGPLALLIMKRWILFVLYFAIFVAQFLYWLFDKAYPLADVFNDYLPDLVLSAIWVANLSTACVFLFFSLFIPRSVRQSIERGFTGKSKPSATT